MERFHKYLGTLETLTETTITGEKKNDFYIHPALKNTGCLTLVMIREAIAPVIFRNAEQEITDIEFNHETYIRAVPNKFKFIEKGRGLQILRAYQVGGKLPQNKTVLRKKQKPSEAYDMNTLVFGDSAVQDNRILPVRTAVNYSDGISLLPKQMCVDESFHNRAMEDGTLFDAESKKNSDNLFTRFFILPETLMIQVLSTRGKVLPPEGLDHLLLSMGLAGAYGGQTSTTGVNIRSRFIGMYGSQFERPQSSPYEIVKALTQKNVNEKDVHAVTKAVHEMMSDIHDTEMDSETLSKYQQDLIHKFETEDPSLETQYKHAEPKVAELFDSWFGTGK